MTHLLKVELIKTAKQKRTYFGIGAVIVIELFILVGAWAQGKEVIDVLLSNLSKNFILEGNLMNGNLVLYLVLNSLWFNLPLILMIMVSGYLTSEYKDRTLQANILQSVPKVPFIISKYTLAILFTLFTLFLLMITSWFLAYLIFGTGDLVTYLNGLNFFESDDAQKRILMSFLAGSSSLIFYSVVSVTVGVIFKETTITWIVSAFFLIVTNLMLKLDFGFFNFYFFPKLIDSWQYLFYYDIPWNQLVHSLLVINIYSLIFGAIGVWVFNKAEIG